MRHSCVCSCSCASPRFLPASRRAAGQSFSSPGCDSGAPLSGSLSHPLPQGALLLSHTFRRLSRVFGRVLKIARQSHLTASPRYPSAVPLVSALDVHPSYRREGYYSTDFRTVSRVFRRVFRNSSASRERCLIHPLPLPLLRIDLKHTSSVPTQKRV